MTLQSKLLPSVLINPYGYYIYQRIQIFFTNFRLQTQSQRFFFSRQSRLKNSCKNTITSSNTNWTWFQNTNPCCWALWDDKQQLYWNVRNWQDACALQITFSLNISILRILCLILSLHWKAEGRNKVHYLNSISMPHLRFSSTQKTFIYKK